MYLDSYILMKPLTVEPDSEFFLHALEGQPVTTSELAETEVFSALLARERDGKISRQDRQRAWQEFSRRVGSGESQIEPLNSLVQRKARQLLERCHPQVPLRTLDALHLATIDRCQDFPLVTTDARLRAAATLSDIPLFPPAAAGPGHSN